MNANDLNTALYEKMAAEQDLLDKCTFESEVR